MKPEKVGVINDVVINILSLSLDTDAPILLGETNIEHMKNEHPEDFDKYGHRISEILESPDYVAKHPRKDSIEYIKVFYDEEKEDYVLVAVRATGRGIHFAKTLFVMADEKVVKYNKKGALKPYKKP
ncbi:transposase [Bacillus sp. AFS077874]|uniref:PBECR3 domain-containing polyvalent protein n=1 Tax=unclassified Bacillus (in: firmicutes) TaxID=185979 RepID=UPI000BF6A41D|nr:MULTISPECIES: PBECR2 nuclease fold domain-containing protein [unclassified Bacillus (in: firmicutes)]PET71582.1 transposase [Bacillus sp. AFS001701]PFM75330.1 transposase [Bacillus sp. AFS077874]